MKITLKQKLLVGFGVLTAIILAIGGLSYFSINKMMESDGLVDHTMDVIAHLQILQYNLKKAEASYRSYLILSQPEFLRSTQSSLNLVEKTASEAQEMTGDNPKQRDNFGQFMPLLQARLDRGRANIQLCLAGKSGEALGNFKETQSLQASDALDKWIDQMITEEQNLLAKRRDAEDANAHTTLGILVLGACTATFFAFGALLVIRREIGHKEKAQGMLQVNEYRLFQFLEAVPLGIFVLDRDGKPFYANQKARELLGHGIVKSVGTDEMAVLNHAYLAGNDKPYPPE
ncbi:MAG TPA: CHASE3 domain-containing protein, partial [bacterium]|nr:CHASE3 domain-containing protein [bacterium]